MDFDTYEFPNETPSERLDRLRTSALNLELIEDEFRSEVAHCHFCRGDLGGPCAWAFRNWMSCVNAHQGKEDVNLENPKCYKYVEGIIKCGNRIIEIEGGAERYLHGHHLNWWIYANMLQFNHGPCHAACTMSDLDARPDVYLTRPRYKKCNDCLLDNEKTETWHLAIGRRIEALRDWRNMENRLSAVEDALHEGLQILKADGIDVQLPS